jgi:glycine hydroxymethyltransferase
MHRPHLAERDPDVAAIADSERQRQRETLAMIASENHVSPAVLDAQGTVFTNKYAEGTPGDRYYGGCEHVDDLERLAVDRAKQLWGADHVNVQPHSGSQANAAALFATLSPGDTVLSLPIAEGGHLSHGHAANATSEHYDVRRYHVDPETGRLDYDSLAEKARAIDADAIVSGFSAYPREIDFERVQAAAEAVGAVHIADIAHITGLVAAGVHESPVGVADVVTGSTHKTIRAGRGGIVMCEVEYASAVDSAVMPGIQGGPLVHNVAGKAVGFGEALRPEFSEYVERTLAGASAIADRLAEHDIHVVSGGTDVHFALVDLRPSHPDLTGTGAEAALGEAGIVCNANSVPGDDRPPKVASGLRLGTPALATRGFDADDCRTVADCIVRVLDAPEDESLRADVRETVADLCAANPLYAGLE